MKFKNNILLLMGSLVIGFIFCEIGLRLFSNFPIHGNEKYYVPHPYLGTTIHPGWRDVDKHGFRNPPGDGTYEIAGIGDSHTQGINVLSEETWPYLLGKALGKSVYNYGVGGYGIYHYLYLAREAIKHNPEYVIIGFYSANDINDVVCQSIDSNYYQTLLDKGIAQAECGSTGYTTLKDIKNGLTKNSAVMSGLYHLRTLYLKSSSAQNTLSLGYFNVGGILSRKGEVSLHNRGNDLSRNVVKNNFEASKKILTLINNEMGDNGIKFGVVIIPSKELVINNWAKKKGVEIPNGFSVKPQKELIANYLVFMKENKIPVIDSTPFVEESLANTAEVNEELYPFWDSHPYAEGYASYSRAAMELIKSMNENEESLPIITQEE